jgi:hypothetical protein
VAVVTRQHWEQRGVKALVPCVWVPPAGPLVYYLLFTSLRLALKAINLTIYVPSRCWQLVISLIRRLCCAGYSM